MFPGIEPPLGRQAQWRNQRIRLTLPSPCHGYAAAMLRRIGGLPTAAMEWAPATSCWFTRVMEAKKTTRKWCIIMHHRCYFSFCVFCMIFSSYIIANTMMIKPAASCNFCLRLNAGIWYLEWKLPRHADTRWHKTHKIICNKLTMGHVSHTDESYSFNGLPTRFIHKASMVQRPNIDFQRGTLRIPVVHTKKHHPYWY